MGIGDCQLNLKSLARLEIRTEAVLSVISSCRRNELNRTNTPKKQLSPFIQFSALRFIIVDLTLSFLKSTLRKAEGDLYEAFRCIFPL